ncbi:GT-D fold domain-containing glycosyltransferase [Candidatus Pantoea floridensis]|uniref:Glycosyltransferase, SP_1767 family n=1 Tax=Candidatus Pantoea floridensis TaxID=1938870 RepID=A0A286BZ97_9GAMM|nr:GT-D fold domain-containing glycosyltransferase [Pantoea floridensis]PIF21948.1 glycosyltransferase family protein [Enterobacteriaceae bacterium JKS000233]SOD39458.1 glycosyltransferase, SP_1767 family [Pantoea floridensis]
MISADSLYRKLRFPFKFTHAAFRFPVANAHARQYQVLSPEQTVDLLLSNDKLSISRYGDGELEMTLFKNIGFQAFDERLSIRLKEILRRGSQLNNPCLLCLPDAFRGTGNMRFGSALFWFFHKAFYFRHYEALLKKNYLYGNTSVTRPYHDYKDKQQATRIFTKFKQLFHDKKILIVEGSGTRLGIGNDLLAGARDIKRITTLNRNAFSVYNDLYSSVLAHARDYDMVLMSLGPTATVLAYDLSQHGIRCIDTGHIDIEYEWMRSAARDKVQVAGKNVNEVGVLLSDTSRDADEHYRQQILLHVGLPQDAVLSAMTTHPPMV